MSSSEAQRSHQSKSSTSEGAQAQESPKPQVSPSPGSEVPIRPGSQQSGPQDSQSTGTDSARSESSSADGSRTQQAKSVGARKAGPSRISRLWGYVKGLPKASPREKLASAGAALFAGLTVFSFMASSEHAEIDPPRIIEHQCETEGCGYLAKVLRKRNGSDVCTDFLGGICGPEQNASTRYSFPGKDFLYERKRFTEKEEEIFMEKLYYIVDLLKPRNSLGLSNSEVQMGKFFTSCLYRGGSEDDARDFFLYLLEDIGIPLDFTSERQSLSMLSALVRLSLIWGIDNPLLSITLRPMRATKRYVTVIRSMQKNFDFEKMDLNVSRKRRDADELPSIERLRTRFGDILRSTRGRFQDGEFLRGNLSRYFTTVEIIFSGRHALRNEDLREMIVNYAAVDEFLKWGRQNLSGASPLPTEFRFKQFEEVTDMKWRLAIQFAVRKRVEIPPDSLVHAEAADTSRDVATLLVDPRLHRAFRHYLYVWLLRKFRPWMGLLAEETACVEKGPDFAFECYYLESMSAREGQFCYRRVREYFPKSLMTFANKNGTLYPQRSVADVRLMLDTILMQSTRMIRNCTFMHEHDKIQIIRTFATMISYIGNPKYFNEMQQNEYNFELARNYFQNVLMIRRARAEARLISFVAGSRVTSYFWDHMPHGLPNADYDVDMNILTIPSIGITYPLHVPGTPIAHSVATLGWHVLLKLFHVFDAVNRASPFKSYRRIVTWHNVSLAAFPRKERCYLEKYPDIATYSMYGTKFAEELSINIAALFVVAESFDFLERQFGKYTMKFYTGWQHPEVLPWVEAMMPFCQVTYIYKQKRQGRVYLQAMTNAMLRELRHGFPQKFECHGDSPMLKPKCPVWHD